MVSQNFRCASHVLFLLNFSWTEEVQTSDSSYIKDSSVAVIVYDVTDMQSFLHTSKWINEVNTERSGDVLIILVVNKIDLLDQRFKRTYLCISYSLFVGSSILQLKEHLSFDYVSMDNWLDIFRTTMFHEDMRGMQWKL